MSELKPTTILYIEDEEDYQFLLQRILSDTPLTLHVASTGEEGWQMLESLKPDLLLLDINLPDTNGYAFCERVRQNPQWESLPILMLTVRRRPEEWLKGFSVGADDYLSKPFNPPELLERIMAGLEGRVRQAFANTTPEYQLIQAARGGNRAAFEVLITKHKPHLTEDAFAITKSAQEADELVAHSFVRAFERLDQFRGESSFYTWLYHITLNGHRQNHRRFPALSIEELREDSDLELPAELYVHEDIDGKIETETQANRVQNVMKKLPSQYRKILQWQLVNDMDYDAMALKLGIPKGTVMSRLFRARTLLKEAWEKALK